jgi:glycosyltransferase involved in cell wall biosynthesis
MRIAMVSTTAIAVPPPGYGGTERVVHGLVEGLVAARHDVTLFTTGDSRSSARVLARYPEAIWPWDEWAELEHVAWSLDVISAGRFDVVHVHQAQAIPFSRFVPVPMVYTLHHDHDPRRTRFYRRFPQVDYVAISARQAADETGLARLHVIHHGIDPAECPAAERGDYVAFLGRFAPVKAPHLAIDAARKAGVTIRLAGRPHENEGERYHAREIAPRLGPGVEWLGELAGADKLALLAGARALLMPLLWEEPFGLVMVESMLCGTPVVAFRRGAAPEIVEDGVTGWLVDDVEGMANAIARVDAVDRVRCRARAVERFGVARMVRDYVSLYERIQHRGRSALVAHTHTTPSA